MSIKHMRSGLGRLMDIINKGPSPARKGVGTRNVNQLVKNNIKYIEDNLWKAAGDIKDKKLRLQLFVLLSQLKEARDTRTLALVASQMHLLTQSFKDTEGFKFSFTNLHEDIAAEMKADIAEMQKCFENACYRSAIILCGRILEIALHRKYYDITGNDILEKSPGIGLGKMVAKLVEKKVDFDPGLTHQIHLINNVRISSVHKKQRPFKPSKAQTHATILFTLDTISKLF